MTYEEFKEKVGSVILTGEGNCPVTPVVQMLQGKWKLQILYELHQVPHAVWGTEKSSQTRYQHSPDQRPEGAGCGRTDSAYPV